MTQNAFASLPSVLLVEDDPEQSRLYERCLARRKLNVTVCSNGSDGARLAEDPDFALVVTDLVLPGLNGILVIARSKELYPARPTLLMSGYGTMNDVPPRMRVLVDGVLAKPFSLDDLANRVVAMATSGVHAPRVAQRTIMAIGAHPDDVERGCGGILARHRKAGDRVVIVTMTRGEGEAQAVERAAEAQRAAASLGAELLHFNLPESRLQETDELTARLTDIITKLAPDQIFTHTCADTNDDHRAVHAATLRAAANVSDIFCYQTPTSTRDFAPTLFVDIANFITEKAAALACYMAKSPRHQFAADYLQPDALHGARHGMRGMSEPIEVLRTRT